MMDGFKDESILAACSYKESRRKKAEEEEKKKQLEALQAEQERTNNMDSEASEAPHASNKRKQENLDGEEDDDLEEDEELRYLNAMQEQEPEGDDDMSHPTESQQSSVAFTPSSALGMGLKRHHPDMSEGPAAAVDKRMRINHELPALPVPALPGKCGKGRGKGSGKGTSGMQSALNAPVSRKGAGKNVVNRGPACGASPSHAGEATPTASMHPEAREHSVEEPSGNHCTWKQCFTVESLNLREGADNDGEVMAPPTTLDKKFQDKWKVEIVKMKPWFATLVDLFSEDPNVKVNEQHIKTAMTSAKKVTAKVNKRLGYETGTAEAPTFHDRIIQLRQALELAKDLRTLVMKSAKNNITATEIADSVLKLQECFARLRQHLYIAIPSHWVQAGESVV